jgi:hypothetical protein
MTARLTLFARKRASGPAGIPLVCDLEPMEEKAVAFADSGVQWGIMDGENGA